MGNGDSNNLISNFKLQGFISINNKNHALVKYKEKTGVINIDSIGGLNTKLIPLDSYVKEINPQEEELIIMIDNEKYNIKLGKWYILQTKLKFLKTPLLRLLYKKLIIQY